MDREEKAKATDTFRIDFVGIGTPRGGTTWVHECLKEHPQVCMPEEKETHFFMDDAKFARGLSYYRTFFPDCAPGQLRGEFDPGYLHTKRVPVRIHEYFPQVKLIVCLRNPAERALSHYYKHVRKNVAWVDSEAELLDESNRYFQIGRYDAHLERYLRLFPREAFHFIFFKDIEERPERVVHELYAFLGVDASFVPHVLYTPINYLGASGARVPSVNALLFRPSRVLPDTRATRALRRFVRRQPWFYALRTHLSNLNTRASTSRVVMPAHPRIVRELAMKYAPTTERVEQLTGRTLPHWRAPR